MILGVNGRFLGARATGVQRFAAEITRRLWSRTGEAVLLVPSGVVVPADHPPAIPVVQGRLSGQAWERLELPGAARRAPCDVVFHPANTVPSGGGPHVVAIHDVEPLVRPEAFSRAFASWYRFGVAPAVRRAAGVVTVSRASALAISEVLGIDLERIRVADQGAAPFDRPAAADAVAAVRVRFRLADPYLLAVGGTDPRKNVAFVRAVLARWRERGPAAGDVPALVVVSGGDARIFAAGERAADAGEIDVGRVDDETLRALYTGAAAFVFPSLSEGFGRPPLEALACGAPVITSPYPAAQEVLGDAALRVPLDPDAWIAAITALTSESPSLREARRERGRARAASHSWDAGVGVVLDACTEAARPRIASPRPRVAHPQASSTSLPGLRVAVVHDWLVSMRGGERVVDALLELVPQAELFTLLHVPGSVSARIEERPIHTSFIQELPDAARRYRWYLPLFPRAIERFDFSRFDLVISSSHCVAKGAITRGVPHLCYCHTPMRYVWDQFDEYFGPGRASAPVRAAASAFAPGLRRWDRETSGRVHRFVANSEHVRERIRTIYGREADVVYPPVDLDRFEPAAQREDFYLIVSALVPYKRIDLAIDAMSQLGRALVVVGSGPELPTLRARAGKAVRFAGWLPDEEVAEMMGRCRALLMPGVEDFGLVPVEAQASGAPVIALARGGALETVLDAESSERGTGIFIRDPTVESIKDAVLRFENHTFDPRALQDNALRFHPDRFREGMLTALEAVLHPAIAPAGAGG